MYSLASDGFYIVQARVGPFNMWMWWEWYQNAHRLASSVDIRVHHPRDLFCLVISILCAEVLMCFSALAHICAVVEGKILSMPLPHHLT